MRFEELCKLSKGLAMKWMASAKANDLKAILKGVGVRGVSKMKKSELIDILCIMVDNEESTKVVIDTDEVIDEKIAISRKTNELFGALFNSRKDDIQIINDEVVGVLKELQHQAEKIDKIIQNKRLIDEINDEILKDSTVELRSEYFITKKGEVREYIYLVGGETYIDCSYYNIQKDDFLWISKGVIPNWFDLDEIDDDIKDDVLYYYYDDSYIAIENPYAKDIIDFNCSSNEIENKLMNKFGFRLEFVTSDFCDVYVKDTDIVFSICVDTIIDAINGKTNIDSHMISFEKLVEQKEKYTDGAEYVKASYELNE